MGLFLTLINLKINLIWLQIVTETRVYLQMQKITKQNKNIIKQTKKV